MRFCSDIARASGEPIVGTTFRCRAVVFLPLAKPDWGRQPLAVAARNATHSGWIEVADILGLAVKTYDPRTGPFSADDIILCGPNGAGVVQDRTAPNTIADLNARMQNARVVPVPLHFVCTHGQRERCCALYGMGIVKALRADRPDDIVLESSHLGGDRFAAVLYSATTGDMLGSLRAGDVVDAVARTLTGSPPRAHWRGSVFKTDLWAVAMARLREDYPDAQVTDLTVQKDTRDTLTGHAFVDGRPMSLAADLSETTHIVQPCCVPASKRLHRTHITLQNLRVAQRETAHA